MIIPENFYELEIEKLTLELYKRIEDHVLSDGFLSDAFIEGNKTKNEAVLYVALEAIKKCTDKVISQINVGC